LHKRDVLRTPDDAAPDEPPPPTDWELFQRLKWARLTEDDREFCHHIRDRAQHSIAGLAADFRARLERLVAACEAAKG
jgi:hypothetical protein